MKSVRFCDLGVGERGIEGERYDDRKLEKCEENQVKEKKSHIVSDGNERRMKTGFLSGYEEQRGNIK